MLELTNVCIEAGGRVLVRNLSAQVGPGDVLAVMGESGSGKSSLLAYLCGALAPGVVGRGEVRLGGCAVHMLPTAQRRIAVLFQDDLLFPHLSVLENLLFALPALRGVTRIERIAQAQAALGEAQLEGMGARMPHTLSGGQRARVSVLRALLAQPRAVLLDEPFSRLDAALRSRFRDFVFQQLRAQSIPAVLVTHDRQDAPAGARCIQLAPQIEPRSDHV
jgi:putative thiamine transport system ATP-binding protein